MYSRASCSLELAPVLFQVTFLGGKYELPNEWHGVDILRNAKTAVKWLPFLESKEILIVRPRRGSPGPHGVERKGSDSVFPEEPLHYCGIFDVEPRWQVPETQKEKTRRYERWKNKIVELEEEDEDAEDEEEKQEEEEAEEEGEDGRKSRKSGRAKRASVSGGE